MQQKLKQPMGILEWSQIQVLHWRYRLGSSEWRGGVCKWKSQDTQGVCYANGTRLNGSNVSHGHTGTNRDALSGLTSIWCVTS